METTSENTIEILDGAYGEKKYTYAYYEGRRQRKKAPVGGAHNPDLMKSAKRKRRNNSHEEDKEDGLYVDRLASRLESAFINRLKLHEGSMGQIQWVIDSYTEEDLSHDPYFNRLRKYNKIKGNISTNTLVLKIKSKEEFWLFNHKEGITTFVEEFLRKRNLNHQVLNESANMCADGTYVLYISIPEGRVSDSYITERDYEA